jgi:L-histidine N-alpha-methyltransferase
MKRPSVGSRSTIITTDTQSFARSFAEDVDQGLSTSPKHLPCIYFYDYRGSLLFEEICRLPEYYLTGVEAQILRTFSEEIISYMQPDCLLVELGSGSCTKTQCLIEELLRQYDRVTYSPIDISQEMLNQSAMSLLKRYDNLEVISVAAEYEEGLYHLGAHTDQPKLILWLGSSIGNFELREAMSFLRSIFESLAPEDLFLIGFDLKKDRRILEKAYNDSRGVTAEFNLNLLYRINRELGGRFDPERFSHQAIYNEEKSRIEMYLVSSCEQEVYVADFDRSYHFDKGERIHTENSHKYSLEAIGTLADRVGMRMARQWLDPREYFCLTLFATDRR